MSTERTLEGRTILVTGGAGFIGSHFIRMVLRRHKHAKVVNLDKLTYAGNLDNLRDVESDPRYEFILGDIRDKGLVRTIFARVQAVVISRPRPTSTGRSTMPASSSCRTSTARTRSWTPCAPSRPSRPSSTSRPTRSTAAAPAGPPARRTPFCRPLPTRRPRRPATTLARALKNGLHQLEFLVVQDLFMTYIGSYSHVVLPGVGFAEKNGTFTNMERRVQRVRKAISPVGNSRPDWKIFCDLSAKMGYSMGYQTPAEILEEISSLVPFYTGISYANLEKGGIQWSSRNGWKKRFFAVEYTGPIEQPDDKYPLWIIPRGFHYH